MGVLNEHFYTRQKCGLFDVSHMGQVRFFGKDREKFVEFATVADVQGLAPRTGRLSLIPNENGGVVDDCMVHRFEDHVYIVINGACVAKDLAHFEKLRKQMGGDVHMKFETDVTLVAIQGPLAQKVMSQWVPNLEKMAYMSGTDTTIDGIPVHMTRCGYTGEDGFEISVSNKHAMQLAELLTTNTEVEPIGLGARDSLRLECGMCLYGHELSMTTSPVSANLMWLFSKRRLQQGGFLGYKKIKEVYDNKEVLAPTRRVGVISRGPCAREHTKVFADGKQVGELSSGGYSPCLGHNVAQAYLNLPYTKPGTKLTLDVRGKTVEAEVAKFPFVQTHYYKL